jgi:uncharacterized membrane protein YccC
MPAPVLVFMASLMAFCFAFFVRRRYDVAVFFVTLMIVLMTEASIPVHLGFTAGRLLSTLIGGALALAAALLFWPRWEQSQSPGIIAAALRANRKYLEAIATQFAQGKPFAGDVILAKREAERANSQATASLRRLLAEPAHQHRYAEQAAALTTYNQRLTRAITLLGHHLNKQPVRPQPEIQSVTAGIREAMDSLAARLETGEAVPAGGHIDVPTPATPDEPLVYAQLTKVSTEVEAMTLAAGAPIQN